MEGSPSPRTGVLSSFNARWQVTISVGLVSAAALWALVYGDARSLAALFTDSDTIAIQRAEFLVASLARPLAIAGGVCAGLLGTYVLRHDLRRYGAGEPGAGALSSAVVAGAWWAAVLAPCAYALVKFADLVYDNGYSRPGPYSGLPSESRAHALRVATVVAAFFAVHGFAARLRRETSADESEPADSPLVAAPVAFATFVVVWTIFHALDDEGMTVVTTRVAAFAALVAGAWVGSAGYRKSAVIGGA
jgi:hypothetical protein